MIKGRTLIRWVIVIQKYIEYKTPLASLATTALVAILLTACSSSSIPKINNETTSLITYGVIPPQLPSSTVLSKSILTMKNLAGKNPFIVHLYINWADYNSDHLLLSTDISAYAKNGLQIDLAIRYVPTQENLGNTTAYANFVAQVVKTYAAQPALTQSQVTNEANSPFNAGASDGAYPQAMQALVSGIESGYQAKIRYHSQVKLGFNWFYSFGQTADVQWWTDLGKLGGKRFAQDVNWVGVDDYPGTWVPSTIPGSGQSLANAGKNDVIKALNTVRTELMPLANLNSTVQLGLSEIGWATNPPTRSLSEQSTLVKAFSEGACSVAKKDNVGFMQWFELIGKDKSGLAMGLMSSTFTPKPAFSAYKSIIANGCH